MRFWMISICILLISISLITGCGDNGLITLERPSSYTLNRGDKVYAMDMPSGEGTQWTYLGDETSFNLTVSGTYLVSGITCRKLENSSDRPTDYLSASGKYLTLKGQFLNIPINIKRTYFYKDAGGYYEMAFDVELPEIGINLFHQVLYPKRLIWKFPFGVGDEWEVFNKENFPEFKLVRRVKSYGDLVEVPEGGKRKAYLIEEFAASYGEELSKEPVSRYWFVPGIGVARYEFLDKSGNWVKYKLSGIFLPPKS
ncbi:TPA: hypothetical protein EYP37_00570 [Candidatus Poribacteria bacterium]|nr:hypothetical protein [Candidatus Poribacteria bacterium]